MSLLANLNASEQEPERLKRRWVRNGVLALLLLTTYTLGTTLAGNIGINSGSSVEFGQGIAFTATCDQSLTFTPETTFRNSTGAAGDFYFSGFRLSDIDMNACTDVSFTVRAFTSESSSALLLSDSSTSVVVSDSRTSSLFFLSSPSAQFTLADTSRYTTEGTFTVTFVSPMTLAKDVLKVALEVNDLETDSSNTISTPRYRSNFDASPYYYVSGLGGFAVVHPDGYVCGVIVGNDYFSGNDRTMTSEYMGCPIGSRIILQTKPSPSGNVAGWHGRDVLYDDTTERFYLSNGTSIYKGVALDQDGRIWDTGSGLTLNLEP